MRERIPEKEEKRTVWKKHKNMKVYNTKWQNNPECTFVSDLNDQGKETSQESLLIQHIIELRKPLKAKLTKMSETRSHQGVWPRSTRAKTTAHVWQMRWVWVLSCYWIRIFELQPDTLHTHKASPDRFIQLKILIFKFYLLILCLMLSLFNCTSITHPQTFTKLNVWDGPQGLCTYPGILSHSSSVNLPSYNEVWWTRPAELEVVWLLCFVRLHSFGLSSISDPLWRYVPKWREERKISLDVQENVVYLKTAREH